MRRGRWWYRAQRPKCWIGRHQWRPSGGTTSRGVRWYVSRPDGRRVKAVCRVCFKREFE